VAAHFGAWLNKTGRCRAFALALRNRFLIARRFCIKSQCVRKRGDAGKGERFGVMCFANCGQKQADGRRPQSCAEMNTSDARRVSKRPNWASASDWLGRRRRPRTPTASTGPPPSYRAALHPGRARIGDGCGLAGRLTIWRGGCEGWTSHAEIGRMFDKCRVRRVARGSGFGLPAPTTIDQRSGLSRTLDRQLSTGCGASDRGEAERRLAAYIADKYEPSRRERHIAKIQIADVIGIYLADVVPGQARPAKAAERAGRLLDYFGTMALDDITGASCRAYEASRVGQGRSNKGTSGGARRDLQDLAAAINHRAREGLHRGEVRVALPPRGMARQRWLTRGEAARVLWACWTAREVQEGVPNGKRPLRHLCRFLLLALYTGSRPGAVLRASWMSGPGLSRVDTVNGVFHRHAEGARETAKRQPTVRLAPGLLAHLRRWERIDAAKSPSGVFVVTFNGQPIASVKTGLSRACGMAKVAGVTAYTLRHTAASWLVAEGLATRKVADFLGTSEPMILNHYGHLAPDYQNEAAAMIGRGGKRRIGGGIGGGTNHPAG
jgi:integrase